MALVRGWNPAAAPPTAPVAGSPSEPRAPAPQMPRPMEPDREQAHLPAEQPPPREDARFPAAHAYARRPRHHLRPPAQGSPRALRLIGGPSVVVRRAVRR